MHFNGPAGRYLGWCAATLLRTAEEDEGGRVLSTSTLAAAVPSPASAAARSRAPPRSAPRGAAHPDGAVRRARARRVGAQRPLPWAQL